MRYEEEIRGLAEVLEKAQPKVRAVVMPDLFIDHFVSYPGGYRSFAQQVSRIVRQGGGAVLNVPQTIVKGGNAVNTALALSRLGGEATLILRTDEAGFALLKRFCAGERINLDCVKTDGRMAVSTQLEFKVGRRVVNVMVGDQGSVSDFGPEFLTEADLHAIETADYVGVFNWSENKRCVELADRVFTHAKSHSAAKTFFDPGDPSTRPREIEALFSHLLRKRVVDTVSLNENEFSWFIRTISGKKTRVASSMKFHRDNMPLLFEQTRARLDLHTADYALSFDGGGLTAAPAFEVAPRRSTAAGDAWNAADMVADSLGLSPVQRLLFANAAAGCYISRESPQPPSIPEIITTLKSTRLKTLKAR